MDISGVQDIIYLFLQGIVNTFRTWNNMIINDVSYLALAFSFIIASIIFTIVFSFIRSRLSNPYTIEKRKSK